MSMAKLTLFGSLFQRRFLVPVEALRTPMSGGLLVCGDPTNPDDAPVLNGVMLIMFVTFIFSKHFHHLIQYRLIDISNNRCMLINLLF